MVLDTDSASSSDVAPPRTWKPRRGTVRSRYGCNTCKIRRIKCDEARPSCMRCSTTGRHCDGYMYQPYKDTQLIVQSYTVGPIPMKNPYLDFPGTRLEHRFLAFFRRHTAAGISGWFDSDFWNETVPMIGQSEPAIQHAMIAVAAVHARLESIDNLVDGYDKDEESRRLELRQYNKAVHYLRRQIVNQNITINVTLMCCMLLICLEFMRGNIEQAVIHLQAGINIIHTHNSTLTENAVKKPRSSEHILPRLENIFHHLHPQLLLCSKATPSIQDIDFSMDQLALETTFDSLQDAAVALDRHMCFAIGFVNSSYAYLLTPSMAAPIDDDVRTSIEARLRQQLDRWSDNFDQFLARPEHTKDANFTKSITLLRILYLTSLVWLSSSTSPKEIVFDDYFREFSLIVDLAASIASTNESPATEYIYNSSATKKQISFTFEWGVIAPLYFTALTCRDRRVRWKALSLLSSRTPKREGLWDAAMLSYVAQRGVEIEEAGLEEFVQNSPDPDLARWAFVPREEDRVVDVTIHHEQNWQHEDKKGTSITFTFKSADGLGLVFRKEDIVLGPDSRYSKSPEGTSWTGAENPSKWRTAAFKVI